MSGRKEGRWRFNPGGQAGLHRAALFSYFASNPDAGQPIPGSGGARTIRWAVPSKNKRGGGRTIYYYHNESILLFILDINAKNQKSDLSEADKRDLKQLLSRIPAQYAKGARPR